MAPLLCTLVLLLGAASGCNPQITGAACRTDENCPRDQFCDADLLCHAGAPGNGRVTGIRIIGIQDGLIPKGELRALAVSATLSSGDTRDVTAQVQWSVSEPTVANFGVGQLSSTLEAFSEGTTQVTAKLGVYRDSTVLAVINAELTSLDVTSTRSSIALSTSELFVATGTYSDGTREDLSSLVTWSSSNPEVADFVVGFGTYGLVHANAAGSTQISATRDGVHGSATLTVTNAVLTALDVTPSTLTLAQSTSQALSVIGTFSDQTTQDLTESAIWGTDTPTVASFSHPDVPNEVVAHTPGTAQLTATVLGESVTTGVTVTNAKLLALDVTPPRATLAVGTQGSFLATGRFDDGSHQDLTSACTWTESDDGDANSPRATVNKGLVRALAAGSATLTASLTQGPGQVTQGTAALTVTSTSLSRLEVSASTWTLGVGTSERLAVTGIFADGTTQDLTSAASFETTDASVLSFNFGTQGTLLALAGGSAQVSAHVGTVASPTRAVTVSTAELTALELSAPSLVLAVGTSYYLGAVGRFSDGRAQDLSSLATWTVSKPGNGNLAAVKISNGPDDHGRLIAEGPGTASVTASFGAVSEPLALTVSAALLQRLSLSPAAPLLANGVQVQLTAAGLFSDGTVQDLTDLVTWSSSQPGSASVSNATAGRGVATGFGGGTTTFSATFSGVTGSTVASVSAGSLLALSLSPTPGIVEVGTRPRFTASGRFSDANTLEVTRSASWVAVSTPVGALIPFGPGDPGELGVCEAAAVTTTDAVLSAQLGTVTTSTQLTVAGAAVGSLSVSPSAATVLPGTGVQLQVVAHHADGTAVDVTDVAVLDLLTGGDAPVVAESHNDRAQRGWLIGRRAGSAMVRVSFGGKSTNVALTVSAATVTGLSLSSAAPSVARGASTALMATATLSDASHVDVTSACAFSESDTGGTGSPFAAVSNGGAGRGISTGLSSGSAKITASFVDVAHGVHTAFTTVQVTAAVLQALQINPFPLPTLSLAHTATANLVVLGAYSDHTVQDLTGSVTFVSNDPSVADFPEGQPAGLLRGVQAGQTSVTASLGGVSSPPQGVTVTP